MNTIESHLKKKKEEEEKFRVRKKKNTKSKKRVSGRVYIITLYHSKCHMRKANKKEKSSYKTVLGSLKFFIKRLLSKKQILLNPAHAENLFQ